MRICELSNLRSEMEKDNPTQVAHDVVVKIEYTLSVDEEILDSSQDEGPLEYLHGYGNIVSGLERALKGCRVGDELQVSVSPEDGYGVFDPQANAHIPRIDLPADIPLEVGTEIVMEDEDGSVLQAVITWVGADEIKLDFNHPLAGANLNFDIKVVGLRSPTSEELEHGHVHSAEHDH
jgi:FKBP-type peptidyl-prolyl cis-trans isomerase SlyD